MAELDRIKALMESNPVEAARLLRQLNAYVMHPHPGQRPVLDDAARFKVLNCGRRWGKTMVGAKSIVNRAQKPGQIIWWVAPTYKIVKRGYAEVLKQLPPQLLTHDPPPDTNFDAGRSVILRLKNGSHIEFYSATMPESMLGASVDYVVVDEAATMKPSIWHQIISPTLMDRLGESLMISTPRGLNWFYLEWLKGQDPDQHEYASWTFTSYDNPHLPPGEVERLASSMPQLERDQEINAKFLAAGSSVFIVPERAKQRVSRLRNGLLKDSTGRPIQVEGEYVVLGIDLAKTRDWTVIYGARASDRRNCFFERSHEVSWGEQKRRIRRAVNLLKAGGAAEVLIVIDSTGLGDPIQEDLEADGLSVVGVNFSGQNKPNMVKLLSRDLERAEAFVIDDEFIDSEFQAYTMEVTPAGRYTYSAPEGMHDDVVSAKMLQHHGLVNESGGVLTASDFEEETPEEVQAREAKRAALEEADPFDDSVDGETWDDLVDDDDYEPTDDPELAAEAVGLPGSPGRMTLTQVLHRGFY
jgi:hypothetical protein